MGGRGYVIHRPRRISRSKITISLQPSYFLNFTHSLPSWADPKLFAISRFRTLFITTGDVPSLCGNYKSWPQIVCGQPLFHNMLWSPRAKTEYQHRLEHPPSKCVDFKTKELREGHFVTC